MLDCREPNFKIIVTEKFFSKELDEFCKPIFVENKYELLAILYSKNATPVVKTDLSSDVTTVTYAGHILSPNVPVSLYNREVCYEMLTGGCGDTNMQKGNGFIVPLARTSNKKIRKHFGIPISLVIRINLA
jgi:hypothetical protein